LLRRDDTKHNRTRSLVWEDETPAEPRFRRVQQVVPLSGRTLAGMTPETEDPDGDDSSRPAAAWRLAGRRLVEEEFAAQSLVASCEYGWPCAFAAGHFGRAGRLGTSAYLLKTWLGRDGRFRIEGASNIKATGLTEVSRAEMLPVFGEDIGRNIFFVPLSERRGT